MIYSRKLFEKFLPEIKNKSDHDLISACGQIGTEIEHIYKHPKLENFVIGEILSHEKHPNADKLNVCKVKIDKKGTINTIVCGASNVTDNKKVIVALANAQMVDGRVIEYKELRGVKSEGMLCAYAELTNNTQFLSSSDEHKIILLDDAEIGDEEVGKYIGLNDTLYDISIPFANRNDFNGVLSLCQELAGFFDMKFKYPEVSIDNFDSKKINITFEKDSMKCYCISKVENVNCDKDSPWELKGLLMNNGIKPLNDTLDKLNYITLLTNVSSAAYDMDKIKEFKLEFAKNNDKFIGFGEKEYLLNDKDVIIKSENDIICLAGILGANEFGVSPQTKNIYVEFANFNYATIRRTAQRLNIRTDASRRFSKPIANYSAILSNNLLKQMFDKTETLFIQSDSKKQKPIKINSALSNTINGTKMGITEIKNKLYKYGFKYEDGGFIYPPYRTDIIVAQDVIEEITKTLKVNEMEDKSIDTSGVVNNKKTEFAIISKIKNLLVNDYFNEVKTYNMISEEDLLQHNYFESNKHLKIVSSHNKNRSYLRNNLLTSMLNVYDYNNLYKNELLPIFEIQKIFAYEVPSINVTLLTQESYWIDRINNSKIVYNVNGLKGIINEIGEMFDAKFDFTPVSQNEIFYDSECVSIDYMGIVIGYIGCIKKSKIPSKISDKKLYCATINLQKLIHSFKLKDVKYNNYSPLAFIIKDVTLKATNKTKLQPVIEEIMKNDFIEKYEFVGKFSKEENINYTLRFYIKNRDKIQSNEIDEYFTIILDILKKHNLF